MSNEDIVEEVVVEDEASVEEPTATDVPEATPEPEVDDEVADEEVDEEVEQDLELAEPAPAAVDLHPGRLAPALVGPSHFDLNPAFAPR